jgi:hypothetical protein
LVTAITATMDPTNSRTSITVVGASGATGYVRRTNEDGTASMVRDGEPATFVSGGWTGYDYEAPMDQTITYDLLSADQVTVQASDTPHLLPSLDKTWLKDPTVPSLNFILKVSSMGDLSRDLPMGVFQVPGRQYPVVTTGRRFTPTGELVCYTETDQERQIMLNILSSGRVLQLSTPDGYGWGALYVAVGTVTEHRQTPIADNMARLWTLPLTVTDRPAYVSLAASGNTWADVIANYATWADVIRQKATWNDLLTSVAPATQPSGI